MKRFSARPLGEWLRGNAALLGLATVLVGVVVLYWPTLGDPFHGDDYVAFTEFKTKSFIKYSEDVLKFEDSNFYWRPLGKISHRLLYEAVGLNPVVFRLAGLSVFVATLIAVYAFCIRERLGAAVALGAAFLLGVAPSHVVSVAWVTNTSRLMAVLFFMLCLVSLQANGRRRSILTEVLACFWFIAAILSDETALALAPIPVIYATFIRDSTLSWRATLLRLVGYGLIVAALLPLQFSNTLDDEGRLRVYGLGPHIFTQTWALVSQLVLPLTPPEPWEVMLDSIKPLQWGAGLAAIVGGVILFIAGSPRLRLLVMWTALSLSPFCLWGVLYTSPRYVYMAAVPYSIILAWLAVLAAGAFRQTAARWLSESTGRAATWIIVGVITAVVLVPSVSTVLTRNQQWSRETKQWGDLATELRREAPAPATGSRIVLFYGTWSESWAKATVWSIYGDHSLSVQVIPPNRLDIEYGPFNDRDHVFYKVGDQLLPSSVYGARR